jgi:hypothetical protein
MQLPYQITFLQVLYETSVVAKSAEPFFSLGSRGLPVTWSSGETGTLSQTSGSSLDNVGVMITY